MEPDAPFAEVKFRNRILFTGIFHLCKIAEKRLRQPFNEIKKIADGHPYIHGRGVKPKSEVVKHSSTSAIIR